MGVYSRFKKSKDGLRQLVQLLETTPLDRRKKMIDVGMKEDPAYTKRAVELILTFDDVVSLPDLELAEVLDATNPKLVGFAIHNSSEEIKTRFLGRVKPPLAVVIRETLEDKSVTLSQIGAGRLKLIEVTRQFEKKGIAKVKRIVS